MTMKTFALALGVLGAAAGVAQADSFRDTINSQRQHGNIPAVQAEHTTQLPARSILSSKDLVNSPLSANDMVTVTVFPSTGVIDTGR